jgi:hypothetical protein
LSVAARGVRCYLFLGCFLLQLGLTLTHCRFLAWF